MLGLHKSVVPQYLFKSMTRGPLFHFSIGGRGFIWVVKKTWAIHVVNHSDASIPMKKIIKTRQVRPVSTQPLRRLRLRRQTNPAGSDCCCIRASSRRWTRILRSPKQTICVLFSFCVQVGGHSRAIPKHHFFDRSHRSPDRSHPPDGHQLARSPPVWAGHYPTENYRHL